MRTKTKTLPSILASMLLCGSLGVSAQAYTPPTTTTTTTAAVSVGQTITLSGATYTVSAKKVLATGVEYYTARVTAKAPAKYFLRTKSKYNPTVFTEAQYAAFYSTRKLSSFGTLQKATSKGVDY